MHTNTPLPDIEDPIAPVWPSTSWVASTPSKCFHPRLSEPRDLTRLDDERLMVAGAAASRCFKVISGGSFPSMELLEEDCDDNGDDNEEEWFDAVEDAQSPPSLDVSPAGANAPIISTTPPWPPVSGSPSQSSSPASTSATAGSPNSLVDNISPPTSVRPEASTPEQASSSSSSVEEDERACQQFFSANSPEGALSSHRQGFFYSLLRKANRNRDCSL